MKYRSILFLFLALSIFLFSQASSLAAGAVPGNPEYKVIKVFINGRKDLPVLANLGFDLETEIKPTYCITVGTGEQLAALESRGFRFKVLMHDASELFKPVKFKDSATGTAAYHTYETVQKELEEYAKKYPELVKLESIGKSIEGRDIWGLKIENKAAPADCENKGIKPAVLFMGAHHAREWISVEVPMEIAKELLTKYGKDEKITKLVDSRIVWIVPMVNPDGVTYSQKSYKYWRKNRRKNSDNSYGVDLNRNYGWQWGNVGASNYPGSDTYHGTGPFSEPECQAIRELAKRENFYASLSYHSYSELYLYPYGWAYEAIAPDNELLHKLASEMAKFPKYTAEKSSELYPAMGDSDDWLYGECGVLAFTVELGQSFIPAESQIPSICAPNVKAALYLLEKVGPDCHASHHPHFVGTVAKEVETIAGIAGELSRMDGNKKNEEFIAASSRLESEQKMLIFRIINSDLVRGEQLASFYSAVLALPEEGRKALIPTIEKLREFYRSKILESENEKEFFQKKLELVENLLCEVR